MNKRRRIKDTLIDNNLLAELLNHKLYKSIIYSNTFKRLSNISFLGAIDYITKTNKKFNRYEHSISVATLALLYAKLKKFNSRDTDILVVSALLHDIGHAPLSHSIENVFSYKYNINHHQNGNNIIKGKSIFKNEIKDILNSHNIDENFVIELLDGKIDSELSFALTNPINIDTIDGINRCYYNSKYNLSFVYKSTDIVRAIVNKDERILDSFWELKNRMYRDFIHKPINLYADFFASNFVKKELLSENTFNTDDIELKRTQHQLFDSLNKLQNMSIEQSIKYKKREYIVGSISLLRSEDINKKYTSYKEDSEIFINQNYRQNKEQFVW